MTQTLKNQHTSSRSSTRVRLRRLATVVAAALTAIVTWTLCVPVLGIDLLVDSGGATQTIGAANVLVVSLVAGALAWLLLALLERFFSRGRRMWRIVGWIVLAVSLAGPATLARSAGALIALVALHLIVGSILIVGLAWPSRAPARRF